LNLILRFKNKVQFSACVDTFEFALFWCANSGELVLKSCVSTWPHLGEHKLQYLSVVPRTGGRSIAVWSNMSTTCNCVSQLVSVCKVRRCVYLRVVSWWLPVSVFVVGLSVVGQCLVASSSECFLFKIFRTAGACSIWQPGQLALRRVQSTP